MQAEPLGRPTQADAYAGVAWQDCPSNVPRHARRVDWDTPLVRRATLDLRIDEAITVVWSLLPRRAANSGGEDQGEGQEKFASYCFADPYQLMSPPKLFSDMISISPFDFNNGQVVPAGGWLVCKRKAEYATFPCHRIWFRCHLVCILKSRTWAFCFERVEASESIGFVRLRRLELGRREGTQRDVSRLPMRPRRE